MNAKKFLAAGAFASAFLMSSVANAAINVTFDPAAVNTGAVGALQLNTGALGTAPFTASGAIGGLASVLTIDNFGQAGLQDYSESGTVLFTNFTGGTTGGIVGLTDPTLTYGIYITFGLSGKGNWSGNTFTAATAVLTTGKMYGIQTGGTIAGGPSMFLGNLYLNYAQPLSATAILGAGGSANTSLTASFTFSPAAGTTGATGFFQSNNIFNLDVSGSNIGGNFQNTSYSPNPAVIGDPVVISVPGTQPNLGAYPGSFNVTFNNRVPEPGALSLVGIALLGLGFTGMKKHRARA